MPMSRRTLERCEICQGSGSIRGVFHVMECAGCNGGGLIDASTCEALPYRDLVIELRLLLSMARLEVARLQKPAAGVTGPAADYGGRSNKHHRGGGHWTGD